MTKDSLNESNINKLLDWVYDKAINGIHRVESAEELANSYLSKNTSVDAAIDTLIRWQITKSATSVFGGVITLPVAIPTNIASVMYVQIRMIGAIAYMRGRGFNLKDDQVKSFVLVCLTGQSASNIIKQAGIKAGTAVTKQTIKKIPVEIIRAINKKVGFRLVTKFGEKGVINLGKAIPLVGGFIGGTVDGTGTIVIGKTAKKVFAESTKS